MYDYVLMIDFNLLYFHIVNSHEITPLKELGHRIRIRKNRRERRVININIGTEEEMRT